MKRTPHRVFLTPGRSAPCSCAAPADHALGQEKPSKAPEMISLGRALWVAVYAFLFGLLLGALLAFGPGYRLGDEHGTAETIEALCLPDPKECG